MSKIQILSVVFLIGIVLSVLVTMFVQWGAFNLSEWEPKDRGLWLYVAVVFGSLLSFITSFTSYYRKAK